MALMRLVREIFNKINSMRPLYLNKIYGMNISPTATISYGAYLDRTTPKLLYIDDGSLVAHGAMILTHDYSRGLHLETRIGKDCFIGARAIILAGVSVGDNVIVGAGSVVTKDVKPNCIVAGNPARIIRENIQTKKSGQLVISEHPE